MRKTWSRERAMGHTLMGGEIAIFNRELTIGFLEKTEFEQRPKE